MTEPLAASAPAKPASLWEDFVDILYAPAKVFERRRGRGFGAPLFILALLIGIVSAATLSLTRPILDRQVEVQEQAMRRNGMNDEQVAAARSLNERIMPFVATGGQAVGILIAVPIMALVLWGVGALFGARFGYAGAGLITTYSTVPALLMLLVGAGLLAVLDASTLPPLQQMTVGPVLLLGPDASPVTTALVTRVGVAELWGAVILGVGARVLGGVSRNAAIGIAVLNWVLGTAFAALLALRTAAAMQ